MSRLLRSPSWAPRAAPLALLLAAGRCTGAYAEAESELREGDRVRFTAPGYSAQTGTGVIGLAGDCVAVMVPDQLPNPRRFDVVPVDSLTALEVSRRPGEDPSDASAGPQAMPGAAGEDRWIPVSVAGVKRRYGSCQVSE
ncbi:MAG TPA: hypothetical protein VE871_01215 [Longimicrobium sp.]|nr:hypothetical protein [Longimicrobium sp.]